MKQTVPSDPSNPHVREQKVYSVFAARIRKMILISSVAKFLVYRISVAPSSSTRAA